ncbi:MAG: hypothetical protein Q9204_001596 [Flavoplaca sp. TL-2023a]
MADPLSLSFGIAGLVTLSEMLFSRTSKYVKAVRNAPEEIRSLSKEIAALNGLLHRVQLLARDMEGQPMETSIQTYGLDSCHKTLDQIKTILDKHEGPATAKVTIKTVKWRLEWPFSKSEAKCLVEEIGRHKSTLSLALKADEMCGLLQVMSGQTGLSEGIREIRDNLNQRHEAEIRIQMSEERRKILDSFGTTTPEKNHDMSLKLRQPQTGLWLTEGKDFSNWLNTAGSGLWLYGLPGAGKTVLAASLIEEAIRRSSQKIAVAFYYCDYKDLETQKPCNILGSLAKQIATQDEQSFHALRTFYQQHRRSDKSPAEYEPQELSALIKNMTVFFETAMIIVDALDECGKSAKRLTKLLAGLRSSNEYTDIRTLFLSRDEFDIRDILFNYPQVSIAAKSKDLELYVVAEMAIRIEEKDLRIKDPSLQKHIMERLIEGADGMFRWVACQIDYLCELPNDAARRRALVTLPPTLKATYERILQKVNESSDEAQKLVQRTLLWIIHNPSISISALCEAVSVETGQRKLDREAIPEEEDILRLCSSLVRKSVSGHSLELAHFTVEEFLTSDDTRSNGSFSTYHVPPPNIEKGSAVIAKIYLTYLQFEDFNSFDGPNSCQMRRKNGQYALLQDAVYFWDTHAPFNMEDPEVLHMVQKLLHPSKSNTFMNWAMNWAYCHEDDLDPALISSICNYAASCSPLHYAASFGFWRVCTWLVKSGCDVNQNSLMGCPLHCAFWGFDLLTGATPGDLEELVSKQQSPRNESLFAATVQALLDLGADPSCYCKSGGESWTPLYLAFARENREICIKLLMRGATVDEKLFSDLPHLVEQHRSFCKQVVDHIGHERLPEKEYGRLLELAAETETCLAHVDMSQALSTAAHWGQLARIQDLVQNLKANVNATNNISGSTALIESCKMDHVEVVRCLLDFGADPNIMDCKGKMPLHYAVQACECQSLPIMLKETANTSACDNKGNNIWHLAACDGNIEALRVIMSHAQIRRGSAAVVEDGCPAQERLTWRNSLEIPTSLQDNSYASGPCTRNNDALTPLHLAISNGFAEAARLLMIAGANPNTFLEDNSSLLHYAIASGPGLHKGLHAIVNMLIGAGVSPCTRNSTWDTPLHDLMTADVFGADQIRGANLVLQTLAQQGANINEQSNEGWTPLHLVCCPSFGAPWEKTSWEDVALKSLLNLSADLSLRDSSGQTPVDILIRAWEQEYITEDGSEWALVTRRSQLCARLMKTIVDHVLSVEVCRVGLVPWSTGFLFLALWLKEDTLSCSILEQQPDMEAPVGFVELSPIEGACLYGCSNSLFDRLLEASSFRSNPTAVVVKLVMLLCQNTEDTNDYKLSQIISKGFDPNGKLPDGTTALMWAARVGRVSFVETLLRHGAQACTKDHYGWNAAHYACMKGRLEVLYALHKTNVVWTDKVSAYSDDPEIGGFTRREQNLSMLHIASCQGNSKVVGFLLSKHLVEDIDCITDSGETALHDASRSGMHENVGLLLEANADDSLLSKEDESPLHSAAKFGHVAVVQAFVARGCQTRLPNSAGLTPEMYALKYGHGEVVNILKYQPVKEGARGEMTLASESNLRRMSGRASESLRLAIEIGDYELCKRLVEEHENINYGFPSCLGCTPLLYSLQLKRFHMAEYLLSKGAAVGGETCHFYPTQGYTAFHYAAAFGLTKFMELLLGRAEERPSRYCRPIHPLHLAVFNHHVDCAKLLFEDSVKEEGIVPVARLLLTYGAIVNSTDRFYETPLHEACRNRRKEMVRLLLDSGASPNSLNNFLQSATHLAASTGCLESLKMLRDAGADLGLQDQNRFTPLHEATTNDQAQAAIFLINESADCKLGLETNRGFSALGEVLAFAPSFILNLAPGAEAYEPREGNILSNATSLSTTTLRRLLRRMPKEMIPGLLNRRHRSLGTPLNAAIVWRQVDVRDNIDLLLDAGADLEVEGSDHGTPLMGACAIGRLPAVKYLIAKGAKTSYVRGGQVFSVLTAAKLHPRVVRWLLVDRFMELRFLADH